MDFHQLAQTRFDRLSSILHFQSYHIMLFLTRITFPPGDYIYRSLRLSFPTTRLCLFWTANNWAVLLSHVAIIRGLLPKYVAIYGAVLKMKQYDRFASHAIVSFGLIEWVVVSTIWETLNYENDMLKVVIEMERTVDGEFGKLETSKLIKSFTRRLFYGTILLRGQLLGTFAQVGQLVVAFGLAYNEGSIVLGEVFFYLWLGLYANMYGWYAMIFPCYFMTHLFFMVRVWKMKLGRAIGLLGRDLYRLLVQGHLYRFQFELMHLHRQIVMYNQSTRRHILMYDLIFKFSGSMSCSMMLKSGSTTTMTSSTWFILSMFICSYAALHSIYFLLTVFPRQCDVVYGLMNGISARSSCVTLRRSNAVSSSRLRNYLKLNLMAEFTGGNNRFGFTYSSLYLIRTINIIENAFTNVYFLILFYKKMI